MDNFNEFIDELISNNISEIAIDVEHHHLRSFAGVTCLIQISTKHADYLIDVLSINIHKLNIITCDPKITKVLHGANSDILWLQKDCGI